MQRSGGKPNLCLADYIAPRASGVIDYIGGFAVTAGVGVDAMAAEYEKNNDEYILTNDILIKMIW